MGRSDFLQNFRAAAALALWMVCGFAAVTAPAVAGARVISISEDNRVGRLLVVAGRSETIRVSIPFSEIVVGDPETADVNPLTDKTLYVLGRKLGTTNVTLFDQDKQLVAVIDIEVTQDLSGLREALREAVPGGGVKVRSVNGRVLLEGQVRSAPAAARAVEIAKDFAPDSVTNSLSIADNQQVNLEVRFVEVSRSAGKDLGVSWNMTDGGNGFVSGNTPTQFGTITGFLPFGSIVANILSNGMSPDILINALEQRKVARRLAEPNLTALSGETASFHAGGEIPIRTCNTDGTNANTLNCEVTYKEFGVKLTFLPTVLDDGLINLSIAPEVSEIDQTLKVGENFSFVTRKAKTSVELRDGQSFAIAGLLQSNNTRSKDQVPWLGDVPVLGTLFRSSSFQKRESDLVIIVTPRLVKPVGTKQQLHTPLDTTLSSNDPEMFLLGKLEVSRKKLDAKYNGVYGHIIDLPKVNYDNPQK